MGDFNTDLLKYDTEKDSADFLDSMYASFLWPYISTPSQVTPRSKTLIDTIFSNNIKDGRFNLGHRGHDSYWSRRMTEAMRRNEGSNTDTKSLLLKTRDATTTRLPPAPRFDRQ